MALPLVAALEHLDELRFQFRNSVVEMDQRATKVVGDLPAIAEQLDGAVRSRGVQLFRIVDHATNGADFRRPGGLAHDTETKGVDGDDAHPRRSLSQIPALAFILGKNGAGKLPTLTLVPLFGRNF